MKRHLLIVSLLIVAGGAETARSQIGGTTPGIGGNVYAPPVRGNGPYAMPQDVLPPPTSTFAPGEYAPGTYPPGTSPTGAPSTDHGVIYDPYPGGTCEYRKPRGHFYLGADALGYDRSEPFRRTIAVQNTTNNPRLRTTDPNFTPELVPRLTGGYVFSSGWAMEGVVYYKDDFSAIANYGETNLVDGVWFGRQAEASDWTNADQVNLRLASGLHSYEVNFINTFGGIQPILGFRYMEYRDRATMTAFDDTFISTGSIGTYNSLIGGQIGAKGNYEYGISGIELMGKIGMYYNDAHITTEVRDLNNTVTLRNLRRNGQNEAYAFELQAMAYSRPLTWLSIRGGYQVFSILNTALAVDQISEIPNAALNTTGFSPNAKGDVIYHGFFVGAEGRW